MNDENEDHYEDAHVETSPPYAALLSGKPIATQSALEARSLARSFEQVLLESPVSWEWGKIQLVVLRRQTWFIEL